MFYFLIIYQNNEKVDQHEAIKTIYQSYSEKTNDIQQNIIRIQPKVDEIYKLLHENNRLRLIR